MKVRDIATGDIYDAWTLDQVETTPNPDAEGEVFVDLVSPSGEDVRMSVRTDQSDLYVLTNDEGYRMLYPNLSWDIFEEVDNG